MLDNQEGTLILGIENPLLDISANVVDPEVYKRYDLPIDATVLAEEKHLPLFKELKEKYNPTYIPGGSTQNTLRAAQWLLNQKQHYACCFIGSAGDDENGKLLGDIMDKYKVKTRYYVNKEKPTGCCGVLLRDTKRCLLPLLGAATECPTEHIKINWKVVEEAKLLYSTAYFVSTNYEALMMIANHAVEANKMFCFNLASTYWVSKYSKEINSIIPCTDLVIGNADEAREYAKVKDWKTEDKLEIVKLICMEDKKNQTRPRTVIITEGHLDTIAGTYDFTTKRFESMVVSPIRIDIKDIVDTNGAGDSFAGGLLVATVLGKDLATAIKYANYLGWECIQQVGCVFPDKCKMSLSE